MKMKFQKLQEIISETIAEELQKLNEQTKYAVSVRDVGTVLVNANNPSEAKKIVAKQLRRGAKDVLNVKKIQLGKAVGKVDEASVKYDFGKVMKLVKSDKFLQRAVKTVRGNDKKKAEIIFKNFIMGDKKIEKGYKKLWN